MHAVLRRREPSCLERSLVLQRWLAAHGERRGVLGIETEHLVEVFERGVALCRSTDPADAPLIDMRMTEEGGLERVPAGALQPSELSARALIRFAPRQVTLGPGERE